VHRRPPTSPGLVVSSSSPPPTRGSRASVAGLTRELQDDRACSETVDAALRVHESLGAWHVASTYTNALAVEMLGRGLVVHREASLSVVYRDRVVGSVVADLLVDERVLVLVRADPALIDAHRIEALRGLAASGVRVGLCFNFGLPELICARVC
jgi:GxxExxY protein